MIYFWNPKKVFKTIQALRNLRVGMQTTKRKTCSFRAKTSICNRQRKQKAMKIWNIDTMKS